MKWRYAGLLLIGLILSGCLPKGTNEGEAILVIDKLGSVKTERFKFTEGTPLGLVKYNHSVETILDGNFIECIDDVCADGRYLWLIFINNKSINYGAKGYRLSDNDTVTFKFTNAR